jgi:hemerythrin superfamily protein
MEQRARRQPRRDRPKSLEEESVADVAIKSQADVIDLLIGQHEKIKSLFEAALAGSGKERESTFRDLRRLLAVHETAEEEILHPRAKHKVPHGDTVVEARLEEEHEAKKILAELEELDVDSAEFVTKLTKLRQAVIDHAQREEKDEFAKLSTELSGAELERMGRAAELAEAIAPTRPHAGVESQIANVMVGPFASMLDRARDAISGKA